MLGAWFDRFCGTMQAIPEVVEFYRMSGDFDYLPRVVVSDIAACVAVYKRPSACTHFFDAGSSFAMEVLKFTMVPPFSYVR